MRQSCQPQSGNILRCPLAHFYSAVDKPDVGHGPTFSQHVAQAVAVIGTVRCPAMVCEQTMRGGQQGLTGTDAAIHIRSRSPVMGLALGQFQADRTAQGINQRMDFRGQAATRATHGPKENKMIRGIVLPEDGSPPFFGPLAPCW